MGIDVIIYFLAVLTVLYFLSDTINGYFDKKFWDKHKYINFPVKYKGKTFWYSRSVAVVGFVFAKNGNGEW